MLLTAIVILLLLASAAAFALVTVARVRRAYNKRRLLAETPGVTCDGIDCMGVSAVCSGITDEKQIENLLSVEYARYEVVLVLDAQRDTQAFRRIAARYQLIGVNCHPSEELPAAGIRGLYRSRQRCYRRLVLLDRAHGKRSDDFDAGVSVATYDYILPLRGQSRLMPRAVERLVVELSEHPPGSIALVRSFMGDTALLFARERVVRAGGFANDPMRGLRRREIKTLYETLVYCPCTVRRSRRGGRWVVPALLPVAALAAGLWFSLWMVAAALTTAAVVWAALRCIAPMLCPDGASGADGPGAVRYVTRKIGVKNFTVLK